MIDSMLRQINRPVTSADVIRGYWESDIAMTENNDCVVRALAVVEDTDYETAHSKAATEMGRRRRDGVKSIPIFEYMRKHRDRYQIAAAVPVNQKDPGFPRRLIRGEYLNRITVGQFVKKFNKGRFFVLVSRHAFAVVDGKIIGNPDDSKRLRVRVLTAYRLKESEK